MKATSVQTIATQLQGEAHDSARRAALDLFGEQPPETQKLSKPKFLEMLRRNWLDPNYRQALLTRIGPEPFLAAAQEAGLIPDWKEHMKLVP